MHSLYYRPKDGWVGDCMPCYHDGNFYLYYQCDKRIPKPFPNGEPFGWSLAKSADMVHFEDYGEVLHKGEKGGREQCIYAGSVIHALGCFRAFYTGECKDYLGHPELPPKEVIMFATSDDGIHWDKHPELTIAAPEVYDKDYFRDPYVFYYEEMGKWLMLVSARRKEGPAVRRGVMIYLSSDDLEHWTFEGELWAPDMYFLLQMPDLFKIGDWWYLFFSELDDQRRTRYRMSKSIFGPWVAPADDCLDGRCFYAARTIQVGDKRYLYGWNPTRDGDSDLGMWIWGGTAVMHEVYQRPDGTLGVALPELFDRRFAEDKTACLPDCLELKRIDGCAEQVLLSRGDPFYRLDMTVSFDPGTFGFGVKIYENSEKDCGYTYHFTPGENQVSFDKTPNYPWFRCMNRGLQRPVNLVPGQKIHLTLIVDDDIAVIYADGVALNARMCEKPGGEIKLYVHGGGIKVSDIRYYTQLN